MLPAVIIFSMIKETGPIITALVVSGRVAAGIGAELGSMKVTEQIDAMEVSAVDPFKYLAATRVVACRSVDNRIVAVRTFRCATADAGSTRRPRPTIPREESESRAG